MPDTPSDRPIIIASRGSALALAQTQTVQRELQALHPDIPIEIEIFKTKGDQLQSQDPQSIPKNLPKGLFTKELESALLDQRADLAVHSLKDLPTELPTGLGITAVSVREDAREVLLTKERLPLAKDDDNPLLHLPDHAVIGTGSPRRQAFLRAANATFAMDPIRGNVPTRIGKLAVSDQLSAIILAKAGLNRLGYEFIDGLLTGNDAPKNIYAYTLSVPAMIPCVGQGAVALEARSDDERVRSICSAYHDAKTQACIDVERTFLAAMGGGCQSPVAAHATSTEASIHLIAANAGGETIKTLEGDAKNGDAVDLAREFAEQLRS